jgi:uncharacterized protein (DUF2235 family)
MAKSKTRYVLFFDGTWNDPQDRTNVYKLARSLPDCDEDTDQRFFYDPGVGTAALGKLAGGTTGYGLSENLQQGYDWLARRYCEGDEIFVFGFSRGAYTARSFVGLIRKCGLLHIVRFRTNYSREVRIRMIGVWDTVGSLGVPGTTLTHRGYFSWHDTQLSKIVDYAAQAMALDEHREAFDIEFWTSDDGNKKDDNIDVEQRWFIGAHANVGGGYGDDALSDLSFVWMQQKARVAGLKLKLASTPADACMTPIRDSYKEFGGGAYAMIKGALEPGDGRHVRNYDTNDGKKKAINVTVDPSVWDRWQRDAKYRPKTLVKAKLKPPGV